MKKPKRISGVKCAECGKRLFSFHVHDFKFCGCPNETFIDGGREYLRYGCKDKMPARIYWGDKIDGIYPQIHYKDRFPY